MFNFKSKNKYGNKTIKTADNNFDSKKEYNRYLELKILEKVKLIKDLVLHPKYELQPSFKFNNETIRAIHYIADFGYYDVKKDIYVVEDVKAFARNLNKYLTTKDFNIKLKLFKYKYCLEKKIEFRLV